jgi:hypothetical protein
MKSAAPVASLVPAKNAPNALRIGEPNDCFEQEADQIADEVTSGRKAYWSLSPLNTGALLQRKCACGGTAGPTGECEECKKKKLQRKVDHAAANGGYAPHIVDEVIRSPGQPLDAASRVFFEPRFSYDFSGVRIHTDSKAAESAWNVHAKAYTVGNHIAFAGGRFAPATREGGVLLAHELAHVVQQNGTPLALQRETEGDDDEREIAKRHKRRRPRKIDFEPEIIEAHKLPGPRDISLVSRPQDMSPGGGYSEENVRRREYFEAVDPVRAKEEWEERKKEQGLADWAEKGRRAKPTKGAELLMPGDAQQAEQAGQNSQPVHDISGKWFQYGMTLSRCKVIYPYDVGGGIVQVTNTTYYYVVPQQEFRNLFWIVGIADGVYQNTKGINVAYGYALKAIGKIAAFTQIGQLGGSTLSTAGEGILYDVRRGEAQMRGDVFTERAPEIGTETIVETAANLIGGHVGGAVEKATGSSLVGNFAGAYSGGMIQKGYEAKKGERSWSSVFAPPSADDVLIGWLEGKVAGFVQHGWTRGRTPVESHPEGVPEPPIQGAKSTEQSRREGEPPHPEPTRGDEAAGAKPSPKTGEGAIEREVDEAAEKTGAQLKLGDGVHGMAAAGEGKDAAVEFCSPGCSPAARKLRQAADDLSKNPQAKNPNSDLGKLARYLRDSGRQIEIIDKELQQGKINKLQADRRSAQLASELRVRAMKYPELDGLLQSNPKKVAETSGETGVEVPAAEASTGRGGSGPLTPADAARAYADRFSGRLIDDRGLEGIFKRTKERPTLSVDRRAAAVELRKINDVLTNGYNGRRVAQLRVVPQTSLQRSPDFVLTFEDGTTTRLESRAFTAAPRGHSPPHAPLSAATRARAEHPITQGELETAILSKARSRPTRFSQLDVPMSGVPTGGQIAITSTHTPLSIATADAAVANLAPRLGNHVQSISLTFPDIATKTRITVVYHRQGTTFVR